MKKRKRGEYGYLSYKKKVNTVKTIVLFAIPISLFVVGLLTTNTRLNALTIVAVLGMLPASQFAVNTFMYCKSKGLSKTDYETFRNACSGFLTSYENVFTTYEKTYEVPVLIVRNCFVCAYLLGDSQNAKNLSEHIKTYANKEGYPVKVNIITKKEAFIKRMHAIKETKQVSQEALEAESIDTADGSLLKQDIKMEQQILKLIFDITL